MDYREHWEDFHEALKAHADGRQTQIWSAIPGIVQSFDATKMTVTVQPAIQAQVTATDETTSYMNVTLLTDVPVHFPHGGGYNLTFPIQKDDECLVVFSSRSIDSWWQSGGVQKPFSLRQHDLADGFALVGPYSQQKKITNVSTTTVQLRSDDGKNYVEIDNPNKKATAIIGATSMIINDSDHSITMQAELRVSGNVIAGYGGGDSVTLQGHTHTQGPDSHNDGEEPTNKPTAGT